MTAKVHIWEHVLYTRIPDEDGSGPAETPAYLPT